MQDARRGFTLVEMLVTISLIATLSALLVPVISGARTRARTVACISNLRQWGLAQQTFSSEHDGAIPRRGQGVNPLTQIGRAEDWFNCLPPYFDSPPYSTLAAQGKLPRTGRNSIFICPEADDNGGGPYFLPYAMNMYLSPWIRPEPHNLREIELPSCVVFMADAPGLYSATVPSKRPFSVVARHAGCANVLFLDGHVQSLPKAYLGCGVGDPLRDDVRWQTGTDGINQPPLD